MSISQVVPDRRQSPLLSNNPFRNKIATGHTNPTPAPDAIRTVSTNPFLDSSETTLPPKDVGVAVSTGRKSPSKPPMAENTRELFENLNVHDNSQSPRRGPLPQANGTFRRTENFPPRPYGRMPPPGHRPSASEEERRRNNGKPRGAPGDLDIFADPPDPDKLRERKPRRNSESSVRDKSSKLLDPDDEQRRRERRTRRKPKEPSRRLDIIDKLDVTSIYGMGLFHHDGPFDACNPARNRKGSKQAPMQAFPKDSRNMQLGGSGPNNSRLNLDQIHGTGHEAHIEYNAAPAVDEDAAYMRPKTAGRMAPFMDPTSRVEPLHGEESMGLGTSTFLEGAPASRAAIQRRESENEVAQMNAGLSRKKSLAQKIGAVRRNTNYSSARITSPEPIKSPTSPLATAKSESSVNPFFKDYNQEYDRKGAQIAFAQAQEEKTGGRARAPSSPKRGLGLERTKTSESTGGEEGKGGRFLSRVKSIKGKATRARGERREASG